MATGEAYRRDRHAPRRRVSATLPVMRTLFLRLAIVLLAATGLPGCFVIAATIVEDSAQSEREEAQRRNANAAAATQPSQESHPAAAEIGTQPATAARPDAP